MTESSAPTLDAAVLAALRDSVGGDDAFVLDLVETYLADGAGQIAAITAAVTAGDAVGLVRPAHTLKSSSFTVGAMRLGDLARSLEQRGRSGALDEAAVGEAAASAGAGIGAAAGGAAGAVGATDEAAAARAEWIAVDAALRAWIAAAR